ncbi:hypothetical protein [Candidatus Nitrotoga sp. M5]|uniref:hypothetical protein n=1 Tax=Candidatus Nitrotoga sp. M5 TaxID=2890409 RepID=UPI001EF6B333|nr:hypothetical protein [Candidatus Nitrotoga sp. M5]
MKKSIATPRSVRGIGSDFAGKSAGKTAFWHCEGGRNLKKARVRYLKTTNSRYY